MKPIPKVPTVDSLKKRILIQETNGKFFTCKTIKKDGSKRTFFGRLRVKKYLAGGEPSYNREERNHVCVWERGEKGRFDKPRIINCETAFDFRCGNKRF